MRRLIAVGAFLVAATAVAGMLLLSRGYRADGPAEKTPSSAESPTIGETTPARSSGGPAPREEAGPRRAAAPGAEPSRGAREESTGIAGVAIDGDTGAPLKKFVVRIRGRSTDGGWLAWLPWNWARRERAFKGPDGTFEILDLRPDLYEFRFEAEGYLPQALEDLALREGRVRRGLRVKLRRAATLEGAVFEEGSRAPVRGATVNVLEAESGSRVQDAAGDIATLTDREGRFQITTPPGSLRLWVSHAGFVDWTGEPVEVPPGGTREGIAVALRRGGGLDGFVYGPDRSPAAEAQVWASRENDEYFRQKQAVADAKGYFRILGLAAGRYRVQADPPPRPGSRSPRGRPWVFVAVEEGRITRVEFPEPRGGGCAVRGHLSRRGERVASALVDLVPTDARRESAETRPWGIDNREAFHCGTAKDGAFAFERVPPGKGFLSFALEPWGKERGRKGVWISLYTRVFSIVVPDAPEFVFDAALPPGEIAGRVVRASDGSPVAGASLQAVPLSGPAFPSGPADSGVFETDPEGRYRIRDLRPGEYFVRLDPQWGGRSRDPFGNPVGAAVRGPVAVGENVAVLDFALPEGGSAVVRVRDPSGRPVPRAGVSLRRADAPREAGILADGWAGAEPGEEGVFRADGLAPGLYWVKVLAPGYAAAFTEGGWVESGEETAFEVDLREGTRVLVKAVDEDGSPVDVIWVDVADAQGRSIRCVRWSLGRPRPEEKGSLVAVLAPGDYELEAVAPGRRGKTTAVRVGTDSPQEVVVLLEREEGPK